MSLEKKLVGYLKQKEVKFVDNTNSKSLPDFFIDCKSGTRVSLELKEKKKSYSLKNWPKFKPMGIEEEFAFIEDELSIRRLCYYGPHSFLLVYDQASSKSFYLFDLLDLFCVPKARTNRKVQSGLKGKWLLDLRWGVKLDSIDDLIPGLTGKFKKQKSAYGFDRSNTLTECYGDYLSEELGVSGIPRNLGFLLKDLSEK